MHNYFSNWGPNADIGGGSLLLMDIEILVFKICLCLDSVRLILSIDFMRVLLRQFFPK